MCRDSEPNATVTCNSKHVQGIDVKILCTPGRESKNLAKWSLVRWLRHQIYQFHSTWTDQVNELKYIFPNQARVQKQWEKQPVSISGLLSVLPWPASSCEHTSLTVQIWRIWSDSESMCIGAGKWKMVSSFTGGVWCFEWNSALCSEALNVDSFSVLFPFWSQDVPRIERPAGATLAQGFCRWGSPL